MKSKVLLGVLLMGVAIIGLLVLLKNRQSSSLSPTSADFREIEEESSAPVSEIAQEPISTPVAIVESTPASESIASPTGPGGITGRVTTGDGIPVPGCQAIFLSWDGENLGNFVRRGRYRIDEPYALTDVTGTYTGNDLEPGIYRVSFQVTGYVFTAHPNHVYVLPGKTTEGIDQVLESAGAIFGEAIENISAKPIEGVRIQVKDISSKYPDRYDWRAAVGWPMEFVLFSDAEGKFQFDFLPPGTLYNLHASHSDYVPAEKESIPVGAGESVRIVLSPSGSIEGRVISNVPEIDPKFSTVLAWSDEKLKMDIKCDAEGVFRFNGLPPNTYRLEALQGKELRSKLSEPLYVGLARPVTGVTLVLVPSPRILGQVVDKTTREGIPNAGVSTEQGESANTDAEGRFAIEGLHRRTYRIYVSRVPKPHLKPEWWEKVEVTVEDEDVEGVILELSSGCLVRGRVLLPDGDGAAQANVRAISQSEGRQGNFTSQRACQADGSFEFDDLKPSEYYRLQANLLSQSPASSFGFGMDSGGMMGMDPNPSIPPTPIQPPFMGSVTSDSFSLEPGEIRDDIILRLQSFARVSGTIKDEQGNPLSQGYRISFQQLFSEGSHFLHSASPNEQGFYFSNQLPSGEIEVALSQEVGRKDHPLPNRIEKKVVTTREGQEVGGVDFVVRKQEGYLSGRVVNDLGIGEPDRVVHAIQSPVSKAPEVISLGLTDAEGNFRIEATPPGTYCLWVGNDQAHFEGLLENVKCPAEELLLVTPRFAKVRGGVISRTTGTPVRRFEAGVFGGYVGYFNTPERFQPYIVPNGKFEFDQVPPKPVQIRIRVNGVEVFEQPLSLQPGEVLSDLVLEIDDTRTPQ